jgi:hypothetical protein
MFKRQMVFFAALLFALSAFGSLAHAQNPPDAVARVPELDKFHEVIFKIWHEAWPEKNTAMLERLLPDVEKGISEVASAQLPGILREKKAVWEEGVKKLQSAGSDYRAAVAAKDETKMLAAAEMLHSRFETLMRSIRPSLKELDEFHSDLYMLYHHYLPQYDLEKIRSSAAELKQKMKALNEAQVPARLKEKAFDFQIARAKLSTSVDALESILKSNSEKEIKAAVEAMHSNYQALNEVCE